MTWTRRKLLGGALGVSIGGLVATCQEPGRTPTAGPNPPPPVVCVAAQPTAAGPAVPAIPVVEVAQAALQPPVPALPPTPAEAPKMAPVAVQPEPPKVEPLKFDPPAMPGPRIDPAPAAQPPAPVPTIDLPPASVDPLITKPEPPRNELAAPIGKDWKGSPPASIPGPVPSPAGAAPIDPLPALGMPKIAPPAVPVSRPKAAEPVPALPKADAAVNVILKLGDGSPRFEVLSGGDVVLKVSCDTVDVRTTGADAAGSTPLVASGKVRFSAPWCEGTCDSLTVQPDNKSVVLTGVRARSKPGKVETEIVAQTMRFRLGVEPDYSVGGAAAAR